MAVIAPPIPTSATSEFSSAERSLFSAKAGKVSLAIRSVGDATEVTSVNSTNRGYNTASLQLESKFLRADFNLTEIESNHLTRHGPSPIRWAGSKRYVVAGLSDAIRESNLHYVEPFAGSAALFFGARPNSATLGDLNGKLINFYKRLREGAKELHAGMSGLSRDVETYNRIRKKFNEGSGNSLEAAIQFAYLNRNCFNGIWRTNQRGEFNVPFSKNSRSEYPSEEHYQKSAENLKRAKLYCSDFRKLIEQNAKKDCILFVDPPYFSGSERIFIEYGSECFKKNDLDDLVYLLHKANRNGARIIFTYHNDKSVADKFPGWLKGKISVTRNVGGFSGSRKGASELLITNWQPALRCLPC
ncbi:MAG: hypothetical protein CMF74_15760 [Maricaulis sp.]|nr:hypothetical protein [Maricaulis sp.]